ncbi:MAG TPA: hypothetical protein VH797_05380 [Nitrososphaeraceae archaeon]|jgi:hypothetical protein
MQTLLRVFAGTITKYSLRSTFQNKFINNLNIPLDMKTKISVILLFISLALLIIYGADVIFAQSSSPDGKTGFLKFDHAIRGVVFGAGPVILSIIAFAISLKEKSVLVVVLLFINGGLIIAGMVGMAAQKGANESNELYGITGLGILLIALGVVKVLVTRKK